MKKMFLFGFSIVALSLSAQVVNAQQWNDANCTKNNVNPVIIILGKVETSSSRINSGIGKYNGGVAVYEQWIEPAKTNIKGGATLWEHTRVVLPNRFGVEIYRDASGNTSNLGWAYLTAPIAGYYDGNPYLCKFSKK